MLFQRTITRGDRQYRIEAELDDEAIMQSALAVQLNASYRDKSNGDWGEWATVKLVVQVNFETRMILVSDGQKTIATFPMDTEVPETTDFEGNDLDVEAEDEAFRPPIEAGIWEEVIQGIPVDPFFGCIIKGAVSTLVGQIIRCCNTIPPMKDDLRVYVGNVAGCLREHGLRMAFTFVCRAGRCMVLAGFG